MILDLSARVKKNIAEMREGEECFCRLFLVSFLLLSWLLPPHRAVDFTSTSKAARRGIRCSGVLKSSVCKFSDEKMNQIIYSV